MAPMWFGRQQGATQPHRPPHERRLVSKPFVGGCRMKSGTTVLAYLAAGLIRSCFGREKMSFRGQTDIRFERRYECSPE